MFYNTMHKPALRVLVALFGELLASATVKLLIVPLNLYNGGLLGVCQLARTLLQDYLGMGVGDIAGVLYFIANLPILVLANRDLGRTFVFKTILCTTAYSAFYSAVPLPSTPIIQDYLTACLLAGILNGIGNGLVLTAGASGGGLDVVGMCLAKRGSNITVGKFSIGFNAVLYAVCLFLFSPEVAIYSVIFNFATAAVMDRIHHQNINIQALIFLHEKEEQLDRFIIEQLDRSATYWEGVGGYSGEKVHVLCVCLSKYEIEELLHAIHKIDPTAFVVIQERVRIIGNFHRNLD